MRLSGERQTGMEQIILGLLWADPFNELPVQFHLLIQVGGGFDWFVSNNVMLNFEAAYTFSDIDTTLSVPGGSVTLNDLNSDYWTIGGGVKYLF